MHYPMGKKGGLIKGFKGVSGIEKVPYQAFPFQNGKELDKNHPFLQKNIAESLLRPVLSSAVLTRPRGAGSCSPLIRPGFEFAGLF